jgi:DNA-binding NtrC family response regulator
MAVVLVVEDENLVRALAEMILQEAKHQTVSASNSEEALSLLQSDRTIDVLFTDLALDKSPEGGIHLAIAARKLRPELSVLYTTGQCVTGGMTALFVQPHGFLGKPYATDQLSMALGNSLRQGRAFPLLLFSSVT